MLIAAFSWSPRRERSSSNPAGTPSSVGGQRGAACRRRRLRRSHNDKRCGPGRYLATRVRRRRPAAQAGGADAWTVMTIDVAPSLPDPIPGLARNLAPETCSLTYSPDRAICPEPYALVRGSDMTRKGILGLAVLAGRYRRLRRRLRGQQQRLTDPAPNGDRRTTGIRGRHRHRRHRRVLTHAVKLVPAPQRWSRDQPAPATD